MMKANLSIVKNDLATAKYELTENIGELKADLIKWMFIFWVG
ncbi:hypothetical protein [Mucilaginibacter panaciglaebae]